MKEPEALIPGFIPIPGLPLARVMRRCGSFLQGESKLAPPILDSGLD
jgi:hypothetical protein